MFRNKRRRRGFTLGEAATVCAVMAVTALAAAKMAPTLLDTAQATTNVDNAKALLSASNSLEYIGPGGLSGFQIDTQGTLVPSPDAVLRAQLANQNPAVRVVQEVVTPELLEVAHSHELATVADLQNVDGRLVERPRDLAVGQPIWLCYRVRWQCITVPAPNEDPLDREFIRRCFPVWTCRFWFPCGRLWFQLQDPVIVADPVPGDPPPILLQTLPIFPGRLPEGLLPYYSVETMVANLGANGELIPTEDARAVNVTSPEGESLIDEFDPDSAPFPPFPRDTTPQ